MTGETTASRGRRKRRQVLGLSLGIVGTVVIGGLVADRVIVSYLGRPRSLLMTRVNGQELFARSPEAGADVTMPIGSPELLASVARSDAPQPERALLRPEPSPVAAQPAVAPRPQAVLVKQGAPRRWFMDTVDPSIETLADSPVSMPEDWYEGYSTPSAVQRLPKGANPDPRIRKREEAELRNKQRASDL